MGTARSTSIEFGCPNYDGVRTSVPRPTVPVPITVVSVIHVVMKSNLS